MPISLGEPFSLDQRLPEHWSGGEIEEECFTRVAILGAGPAGLTCAFRVAQGLGRPATRDDMIVLEREPQVGGRTRSVQIGTTMLDLGALTFQPEYYPRYSALLTELGLSAKVREVPRRRMIFGCDGRATRADNLSLMWDGLKGLVGRGLFTPSQAAQLLRFYVFLRRVTGPGGEPELMALHEMSVAEWARRFGFDAELLRKFVEPFTYYCFRPPEAVSAAFGVFLLGFNLGRPAALEGGFGQVTEALAERLNGLIETEAVALDVIRMPGGFAIVYSQRGRLRRVRARVLVVAVPANVAARIVPEMCERPLRSNTVRGAERSWPAD